MRKYFNIFLGAVFIRNGLSVIQEWISALIAWSSAPTTDVANGNNNSVDVSLFSFEIVRH
jgi:hypothetical protein